MKNTAKNMCFTRLFTINLENLTSKKIFYLVSKYLVANNFIFVPQPIRVLTVIISLWLLAGFSGVYAHEKGTSVIIYAIHSAKAASPADKLIARYIEYPAVLGQQGGIVTISYRVNNRQRIETVRVFSENSTLNQHIISALQGKKVHLPISQLATEHLVRIHFFKG